MTKRQSIFGQYLVETGRVDQAQLERALEMQRVAGGRLGTNLLELGLTREAPLLEALGEFRHCATVDGYRLRGLRPETLRLVPMKFARRHHVVPVARQGNTVLLASTDPGDPLVEDEVGLMNGCLARTAIGLEVHVHAALARYYGLPLTARIEGLARRLAGTVPSLRPAAESGAAGGTMPEVSVPDVSAPPETARSDARRAPQTPSTPPPRASEPHPAGRSKPPPAGKTAGIGASEEPEIEYVELDAESQAMLTREGEASPEARLAAAAEALGHTEFRDDVADVLLDWSAPYLERRLLLILRKDRVVGWRGAGPGVDSTQVRAIDIGAAEPSVFLTLEKGAEFWLNPLPKLPANQALLAALGGAPPKDCLVLPVRLRSRVVAFLYGDNRAAGTADVPLDELKRLVGKAGLAFEVCILKSKIRVL